MAEPISTRYAGLCLLVFPWCASQADEVDQTIVTVRHHATAAGAMQDCLHRSGQTPNSLFPSCFTGNSKDCTIIVRRPVSDMDDYAARDQIGKEIGNCINGHQFPVNPVSDNSCATEAQIVDRLSAEIEAAGFGSLHILHAGQMQAIGEVAPKGILAFIGAEPARLVIFGDGKCAVSEKDISRDDARLGAL